VGEYAAMTLLKYDANHRSRLVDIVEETTEAELPTETPTEETTPPSSTEPSAVPSTEDISTVPTDIQSYSSIADFLQLPDGIEINYQGMTVCDSYPEDGQTENFFTLDATKGKKLLVLKLGLSNNSGTEQEINILNQKCVFKVTVNDSYTRTALVTMLADDLSTYIGSVQPGASEETVLLIEIDENMASAVTSVSLTIQNTDDTYSETIF
jgi:hypothetical protein